MIKSSYALIVWQSSTRITTNLLPTTNYGLLDELFKQPKQQRSQPFATILLTQSTSQRMGTNPGLRLVSKPDRLCLQERLAQA